MRANRVLGRNGRLNSNAGIGVQPLQRLICASEGSHGPAVASAARRARTTASIFFPVSVSGARAGRIRAVGGEIVWIEGTYDDAVLAAAQTAMKGDGLLIADTSPDPRDPVVHDVLEGYALMTREIVR